MKRQKGSGPIIHRAEVTDASILDEESRTMRLSFSSETPYERRSWFDDPWIEILGHSDKEVDMSRLDTGSAPLLYGHDSYSRDNHIGVVQKAWLEKGRGFAEVRLSKRAELDGLWRDIQDGIIRNVSVGYRIIERTLTKKNEKGPSEYRVTRWAPAEVSLVPLPADPSVGIGRSDDGQQKYEFTDLEDDTETEQEKTAMVRQTEELKTPAQTPTPEAGAAPAVIDQNAIRTAERARVQGIHEVVRLGKLDAEFEKRMVEDGKTVEEVRAAAFDALAAKTEHHFPAVIVGKDENEKFRDEAADWLLYRGHQKGEDGKPISVAANSLRGFTLLDLARRTLERAGERVQGLTNVELATRAITHSTSDFPVILQNVLNKTLLQSYQAVPNVWSRFCRTGSLSDFRPHYRYRMGTFGDLQSVGETGEFKDGTLNDADRESITAATKGLIINLSRQMIVNDDLGAFLNVASGLGRSANRTVEKDVFVLLLLNAGLGPTMSDGNTMIHASHNNVAGTAGPPSVATFDNARVTMASQTDPGSNEIIDLRPTVWLGPISLGGDARVVNDAQYDPDTANKLQRPNKVRGQFRDIVDTPRLTGTAWWAFCDAADDPVIEVGFLNGQQTPYTEMRDGWRVDGIEWKVRHDYGVAAVGWRGVVRNAGA